MTSQVQAIEFKKRGLSGNTFEGPILNLSVNVSNGELCSEVTISHNEEKLVAIPMFHPPFVSVTEDTWIRVLRFKAEEKGHALKNHNVMNGLTMRFIDREFGPGFFMFEVYDDYTFRSFAVLTKNRTVDRKRLRNIPHSFFVEYPDNVSSMSLGYSPEGLEWYFNSKTREEKRLRINFREPLSEMDILNIYLNGEHRGNFQITKDLFLENSKNDIVMRSFGDFFYFTSRDGKFVFTTQKNAAFLAINAVYDRIDELSTGGIQWQARALSFVTELRKAGKSTDAQKNILKLCIDLLNEK